MRSPVITWPLAGLLALATGPGATRPSAAPAARARPTPPVLGACPKDHFRQFRCGLPTGRPAPPAGVCPRAAAAVNDELTLMRIWHPLSVSQLRPDGALTAAFRKAHPRSPNGCCYSACVRAPVRASSRKRHSYIGLKCLPAMRSSYPDKLSPHCPVAIEFPKDYHGHVARYDKVRTSKTVRRWYKGPLVRQIRWCCYRSAPLAAIGPM